MQMYTEAFCKMLTSKPEVSGVYPLSQLGRWRHNLFHTANIWKQNGVSASPGDHPRAVFPIAPFRCCFCTNLPKADHMVISNSLCFLSATVHRKRRKAFQLISRSQYNPGTNSYQISCRAFTHTRPISFTVDVQILNKILAKSHQARIKTGANESQAKISYAPFPVPCTPHTLFS